MEWVTDVKGLADILGVSVETIRYHYRHKHIFPERVICPDGKERLYFDIQDYKRLKGYLRKELINETET